MGKKLDVREYQCELIKVLDGDTIDCYIDLGFNLKVKKRVRYMGICLLYTSPSPRDYAASRMPSSA